MRILINTIFIITTLLVPIGILFRFYDISGGHTFLAIGFLGFFIYFLKKSITGIIVQLPKRIILMQIMLVLMSFALFTRYLYYEIGDYPSLIIVPLFILVSLIYLIKEKNKSKRMASVILLYLILTIPLFGLDFHWSPREILPLENRYGDVKSIPISLPYGFEFQETERLSVEAFNLRKKMKYFKAIIVYKKARTLEPYNPRLLFDLSQTYACINELETAIPLLDTAIMIDSTFSILYNNRGLLHYKLKENDKAIRDYQKAIKLDSAKPIFYYNLALVYYQENLFNESCKQIKKAESFGLKINDYKDLMWIKNRYCQ